MQFGRYDRIVDYYATNWPLLVPGYLPILNAVADVVRVCNTTFKDVLDLGCGLGAATAAAAPGCAPEGRVTLVDGSQPMLEVAKRLVGTHLRSAIHGDFTLPDVALEIFVPQQYDLVLSTFALLHISDLDKRQTIDLMSSSLKPGGLLLLADEIAVDRPGGWDVVEQIRARFIDTNLKAGKIAHIFVELEQNLPPELHLPFQPARIEDMASWMARAGLGTAAPVTLLGSALLVGVKPGG